MVLDQILIIAKGNSSFSGIFDILLFSKYF